MLRTPGLTQHEPTYAWVQLLQYRLAHGGVVRSYEDVAAAVGARYCPGPGPECDLSERDHRRGLVRNDTVHWTARRVTKNGLRIFLKVVSQARLLRYTAMNKAMRIYAENAWATRIAQEIFHVRFRSSLSRVDRLQVRWLVSQGMEVTDAAHRWAHRPQ